MDTFDQAKQPEAPTAEPSAPSILPPLRPGSAEHAQRPEPRVVPSAADRIERRMATLDWYAQAFATAQDQLRAFRSMSAFVDNDGPVAKFPAVLRPLFPRNTFVLSPAGEVGVCIAWADLVALEIEKGVARAHR